MGKYKSMRGLGSEEKFKIICEIAWDKFQLFIMLENHNKQNYQYMDSHLCFVDIYGYMYDIMPMHIIKRSKSHEFHKFRLNKFAYSNMVLFFKDNGYSVMRDLKYNNIQHKVKVVDNNGYYNNISVSDLNRGNPENFSANNKYIIQNIKLFLIKNSCKLKLLSTEYNGTHNNLEFECVSCGEIFLSTFANVKRRSNNGSNCACLSCAYLNNTTYNITLANRNKNALIVEDGNIYFLKMSDSSSGEEFYKIGITKNDLYERYNYNNMSSYNYEKVLFYKTNLYNAVKIEAIIKDRFKEYKYIPNNKFGGYTECFKGIDSDEVKLIISELLK